jgi:hypothetical protein
MNWRRLLESGRALHDAQALGTYVCNIDQGVDATGKWSATTLGVCVDSRGTDRQTDTKTRHTEGQTDRHTARHTDKTHRQTHTDKIVDLQLALWL